jgi:hypothetical protein
MTLPRRLGSHAEHNGDAADASGFLAPEEPTIRSRGLMESQAYKRQQAEIEALKERDVRRQAEIDALKETEARLEKRLDRDTTTRRWMLGIASGVLFSLASTLGIMAYNAHGALANRQIAVEKALTERLAEQSTQLARIDERLMSIAKAYATTRVKPEPDPIPQPPRRR